MSEWIIHDPSPYVDKIDAYSRVTLAASNAMDSPAIVKYGDVTRIPGGGITFRDGSRALIPSPVGGQSLIQQNENSTFIFEPTSFHYPIADLLAVLSHSCDVLNHSIYLSNKLKLSEMNPDSVSGYLTRCFCDPGQPATLGATALLPWSYKGVFDSMWELLMVNGYATLLETKFFKSVNVPGVLRLYFKPTQSRLLSTCVVVQPGANILITSELGLALKEREDGAHYYFQNSGDLDEIDFCSLEPYSTAFLVLDLADNPMRLRHDLAEALAFKTAAWRRSVAIPITVARLENPLSWDNPYGKRYTVTKQTDWSDGEFIRQCEFYRLPVDPILGGNPYEIKLENDYTEEIPLVPIFFDRGRLTILTESARKASIRAALFSLLSGKKRFPGQPARAINTLLFCQRGRSTMLQKYMRRADISKFEVYEDAALLTSGKNAGDEMDAFLNKLRPELVLLALSGYTEAQEKSLEEAIDLCLSRRISVGVFCDIDNVPPMLEDMADRHLVIGTVGPGVHIVKEKNGDAAPLIQELNFESEVVVAKESTEKALAEAMP